MSRFFRKGDQGSSSSEESDVSEESESEEEIQTKAQAAQQPKKAQASAFLSSSDDEDEGPRVVKSQRDKRFDELFDAIKVTRAHMKENDWSSILNDFEKLMKLVQKMGQFVQKEGLPKSFVKVIADMEDQLTEVAGNKDEVRKMKPANAKALNAMKQKMRKYTKEPEIEQAIGRYRENPASFEEEETSKSKDQKGGADSDEESEEESDSDDSGAKKPAVPSKFAKAAPAPAAKTASGIPAKFAKKAQESDEDSEEEDEEEDEDWSESSDDSESDDSGDKKLGASKWLKKDKKPAAAPAKPVPAKVEKPKQPTKKDSDEEEVSTPVAPAPAAAPVKKMELTEEGVDAKLKEITSMRGKRGTDRKDQIMQLQMLCDFTKSPVKQAQILVHLTSAQFDASQSIHSYMSVDSWRRCYNNIDKLLNVVTSNPDVVLNEEGAGNQFDEEGEDGQPAVVGNMLAFLERLDEDLYKSLQAMESHSTEYARRLQDSNGLLKLALRIHDYYVGIDNLRAACRASMRRLEHLYYKPDDLMDLSAATEKKPESGTLQSEQCKLITRLCGEIFKDGDDRTKTRAVICLIYYHALHNRFVQGRDLLLMSHLQETIQNAEASTVILFNRAMAQLGLCAFRNGLIQEAHSCLADICGQGKAKELLAQGFSQTRQYERTPDQERLEKRCLVPYHLHINLEVLEFCHLFSATLIEIPNMAANAYDYKRKVINRQLNRLFDYYDRQVLTGPPESMKESVMVAAKALKDGDWARCAAIVMALDLWNHMPQQDQVKQMLKRKIQEEGLRTYLFTFSKFYDAMSMNQLCQIFELSSQQVHSIVSRMMISGELHASWDQPTNSIVMHHVDPTRLQFLSLQFAEKASMFVEYNERMADAKFGFSIKDNKADGTVSGGNAGNRGGRDGQSGQARDSRDNRHTNRPQGRNQQQNQRNQRSSNQQQQQQQQQQQKRR